MTVAMKVLGLLVLLSIAFVLLQFALAKNACQQKVTAAETAIYPEPGAAAKQAAARDKAFLSDECKRTESLAAFANSLGTSNK